MPIDDDGFGLGDFGKAPDDATGIAAAAAAAAEYDEDEELQGGLDAVLAAATAQPVQVQTELLIDVPQPQPAYTHQHQQQPQRQNDQWRGHVPVRRPTGFMGPPPPNLRRRAGHAPVGFGPPQQQQQQQQQQQRPDPGTVKTPFRLSTAFRWLFVRWLALPVLLYRLPAWCFGTCLRGPATRLRARVLRFLGDVSDEDRCLGRAAAHAKRHKKCLYGAGAGACVMFLLFSAIALFMADTSAANDELLRSGAEDIPWATEFTANFSRASEPLLCGELRDMIVARRPSDGDAGSLYNNGLQTSLAHAIAYASRAVQSPAGPPCACAPMFGLRRRYMAIGNGTDSGGGGGGGVVHMFNVRMADALQQPQQQQQQQTLPSFSRVREHQRMLFPSKPDPVYVIRMDSIWLEYVSDESCTQQRARLHGAHARCAQSCLDLFEGISVYERHRKASAAAGFSP